jgi:hypothetical protein
MDLNYRSPACRIGRVAGLAAACTAAVFAGVMPAYSQVSLAAGLTLVQSATTRGVDAAQDPNNNVYLLVSAYGPVTGTFVNSAGAPILGPFQISPPLGHANYTRVKYSPHLNSGNGGFLVTWASENSGVWARVVTYPAGVLGDAKFIGGPASIEAAPALAYSSLSGRFLVAWQGFGNIGVAARFVGLDGSALDAAPVVLSAGYARDPGVAWNSSRNEFAVSYNGESSSGYSAVVIVPPSNLSAFRRTTFNVLAPGLLTYISDIDYSPASHRYVMAWYEGVKARVAEIDDNGTVLADGIASYRVGMYDSLSVSYNPVSSTFLLAGLDPQTDNLTAAELNGHGFRFGSEVTLGSGPAYYARAASSQTAPQWNIQYARKFQAVDLIAQTSTSGGGPAGSYGSTASPGSPSPGGCPGSVPGMTCVNGNWVPGVTSGGTSGGSTGSCPGSVPGMTCVNGNWVPGVTSGGSSGGSTGSCPGVVPGMTCVNGNWVPGVVSGGGTSAGSCPGFVPGMTCVNGNWVPGVVSAGSGSAGGCPGTVPGMTCVNGNWVPGVVSGGSGSAGGCPGTVPGMTCVNGNWVPGVFSVASSSGCPGTVPGMHCVNGNWVPGVVDTGSTGSITGGTSCPGTVPGMTCVNGNWVPGVFSAASAALPICVGGSAAPVSGWLRIGLFDWVPPSHPSANQATCRAQ